MMDLWVCFQGDVIGFRNLLETFFQLTFKRPQFTPSLQMVGEIHLEEHRDAHYSLFNYILLVGIEVHPRGEPVKTMHRGSGRNDLAGSC